MAAELAAIASPGRLLFFLEGGYDLAALEARLTELVEKVDRNSAALQSLLQRRLWVARGVWLAVALLMVNVPLAAVLPCTPTIVTVSPLLNPCPAAVTTIAMLTTPPRRIENAASRRAAGSSSGPAHRTPTAVAWRNRL